MDLSFPRFDRAAELVVWPGDLAALMIGVAARQGASPTACAQGGLIRVATVAAASQPTGAAALFAPADGTFNGHVAAALTRWKGDPTCRKEE